MQRRGNSLVGVGLAAVVAGMVGASFAAVPLYRMFCAATGYGGTPQIGGVGGPGASGNMITVRFNADTSPGLPWRFKPNQAALTVPLGEDSLASYHARNEAGTPATGIATYNVTPEKVGNYFHKTACFCFDQQTLAPHQDMDFPLSFWVDPAISTDPDTKNV
jgi:cytochrome c oxidase assembly protein subunit 11